MRARRTREGYRFPDLFLHSCCRSTSLVYAVNSIGMEETFVTPIVASGGDPRDPTRSITLHTIGGGPIGRVTSWFCDKH
jgi:hypothetical protein